MTRDEYLRERGCERKVRHATPASALIATLEMWRLYREHGWVYECSVCLGYHVGRIPWQVRRFIAELLKRETLLKLDGFTIRPLKPRVIH